MSTLPRSPSGPVDVDPAVSLEDAIDRPALEDLCASLTRLFGIGVRVYSTAGALLASSPSAQPVCGLVNEVSTGRVACANTISAAKASEPDAAGLATHTCFTGLAYRVVAFEYEKRWVGRFVLGPFAPAGLDEPPESARKTLPVVSTQAMNELLRRTPRIRPEALDRLAEHTKTALELIVFSSHRAYVASKLHLYSVRESYRELEEKTRRLEKTLARLTELDRLKSTFLATVSHELRTPLTSIIGYSEMLGEGVAGALSDEQSEFVATIRTNGEQLLGLITGLLDLSKLESGTMELRASSTRIGALLEDVVSTLAPVARKKNIAITLDDDETPLEVSADPVRMRQVFLNLVENAVKFTPSGGRVALAVRVQDEPPEDAGKILGNVLLAPLRRSLVVAIADTGIGVPAHERERIFDAFYQVDSSAKRAHGGAGLGLSIVKRIVQAHGGTVRVEPNEPSGAVFIVTLPSTHGRRFSSRAPAS